MKTAFTIFILTFLSMLSCTSRHDNNQKKEITLLVDTFPIDTIRHNSINRRFHYNLDSLDFSSLKPIDTIFFKVWFDDLAVNTIDFKIQFDKYQSNYFFDYMETDDKFLFSIINRDEIGCDNLFHFTVDKSQAKITQVDYIAQTGGDGGAWNIDIINYNNSGDILTLTSIKTYDSDFDKGYTRQFDSTITQIEFDLLKTKYSRLDSLRRIDTIWSKN